MSNPTFLNYFFPEPPVEWEMDDVRRANALNEPFSVLASACVTIGSLGATFATLGMLVQKIRGQVIKSKFVYLEITSIALVALSIVFSLFGRRHYQGLTEERETELALKEFKQGIEELPVCQSQEELKDKVANDSSFTSKVPYEAIESAQEVCTFAEVYYRSTKDLQPRFKILRHLTIDQQLDLLDLAHEKGIVLHFQDYEKTAYGDSVSADNEILAVFTKGEYPAEIMQKIEESFTCSIKFLVKHLQPLDSQKLDLINEQLSALSFRWIRFIDNKSLVFNPKVYLEDDNTIVVHGVTEDHKSEADQVIWAIESLAPHINTIKVEARGLYFFYHEERWNNFQKELNDRFPGKMIFVDELPNHAGAWQKNLPQELTLRERLADASGIKMIDKEQ